MRGILAHKLHLLGVSQRKIASYLEITQPGVSKLLREPIEKYYGELLALGIPRDVIEHYVEILVEVVVDGEYEKFISTAYAIINQIALRAVCNARRDLVQLCTKGVFTDPDIEYYKKVLRALLAVRGIEHLIPEVGSNLAYAPKPPGSLSDIIGLTGGIVRTPEGVALHGEPAYGGSKHVARVLLLAAKYNYRLKFCFNVKCDKRVRVAISNINVRYAITGPHLEESNFWADVEEALKDQPLVLCDLGGLGLEPVAYVFSEDPHQLETRLRALVEAVHERR